MMFLIDICKVYCEMFLSYELRNKCYDIIRCSYRLVVDFVYFSIKFSSWSIFSKYAYFFLFLP